MRVLALSGSRRAASTNTALLRAAARLAPAGMQVVLYPDLGELPLFNPDDEAAPAATVLGFQDEVAHADALLIASPEYAHGVSGTLKNALDWLVGFEPFAGKLVAVLNASARARHADAALRETLGTMAAQIVEPASVALPILGHEHDAAGMLAAPELADAIRGALAALQVAIRERKAVGSDASPWWA